jgi:hypothetical protein
LIIPSEENTAIPDGFGSGTQLAPGVIEELENTHLKRQEGVSIWLAQHLLGDCFP